MSALLEVSGVSVSFDGFKAINNLSFEIGDAELRANRFTAVGWAESFGVHPVRRYRDLVGIYTALHQDFTKPVGYNNDSVGASV